MIHYFIGWYIVGLVSISYIVYVDYANGIDITIDTIISLLFYSLAGLVAFIYAVGEMWDKTYLGNKVLIKGKVKW